MTNDLEITAPAGEPTILSKRFVKAPPQLVFDMWTKAEHLSNWMGPRSQKTVECTVDLRVGGQWSFISAGPDGTRQHFYGEYLEIDEPVLLANTWIWAGMPDSVSIERLTLTAVDGGTLIEGVSRHARIEDRDQHLAHGMADGMAQTYARLDELLAIAQQQLD